ncbi:hypothetical protein [Amycolatopsis tolypomycina]|uniref:hypothetical protein n=1 Tax=Amycolatopsis tolypomycina TaxID=208445 RepID=UPI0033BF124C
MLRIRLLLGPQGSCSRCPPPGLARPARDLGVAAALLLGPVAGVAADRLSLETTSGVTPVVSALVAAALSGLAAPDTVAPYLTPRRSC